jgi:hypothetical protein
MTPVRAVVAGGLIALVCALVVILSGTELQIASTDRVNSNQFGPVLAGHQHICQYNEIVPRGVTALRMTIGDYGKPGPPLGIDITVTRKVAGVEHVRQVARGFLGTGWKQGVVLLPISRVRHQFANAGVCLSDNGRAPVAIAGLPDSAGDYGLYDLQDGASAPYEIRIDYLLPGHPSWFSLLGTLAERMTLGKGSYVGFLGWLAPLLLMLSLCVVAVRTLLAEEREG